MGSAGHACVSPGSVPSSKRHMARGGREPRVGGVDPCSAHRLSPRGGASVCPRLPAGRCVEGPPVHTTVRAGLSLGGHRRKHCHVPRCQPCLDPAQFARSPGWGWSWFLLVVVALSDLVWQCLSPCVFPRCPMETLNRLPCVSPLVLGLGGSRVSTGTPRWRCVRRGAGRALARRCAVSWPSSCTSPLGWCLQCVVPAYCVPSGQLSSALLRSGVSFHVHRRRSVQSS